jgi:hypothetical protein
MNYDEILRLAQLAAGTSAGPVPPAPAAPPAAAAQPIAPSAPAPAPTPYSPGDAAPGDIHALSSQVLGKPGFFERVARIGADFPLISPVTNLFDLAGSVAGRGGSRAMYERHSLDALQKELDDQARQQAAQDRRQNLTQRSAAIEARMAETQQRMDAMIAQRETNRNNGTLSKESEDSINAQINRLRQRHLNLSLAQSNLLADPALIDPTGENEGSTVGLPATAIEAIRRKSEAEARGTAAGKPQDEQVNPEDYVDNTKWGADVIDASDVTDKKSQKRLSMYAHAHKLPYVDKKKAEQLDLITVAMNNFANTLSSANRFLPDTPLNGQGMVKNWVGQFNDAEVRAYRATRSSAIELVQAGAALGTGNRITQVELNTVLENAFPSLPHIEPADIFKGRLPSFDPGDWKGSAAAKAAIVHSMLQNSRDVLLGKAGAQDRLLAQIEELKKFSPKKGATPAAAPAGGEFDPTSVPGMTKDFDPTSLPGMQKDSTTVKEHTRKVTQRPKKGT